MNLDKKWKKEFVDPVLLEPSIGIGTSIKAGNETSPNKFADICTATLDVRTTPKLHGKVLKLLKQYLKKHKVRVEYLYEPAPFGFTGKEDDIVKAVQSIKPKVKLAVSKGSTDQCFFTKYEISAIIFGPGEKECMHKPNEYCVIEKVEEAVGFYQEIIKKWSRSE